MNFFSLKFILGFAVCIIALTAKAQLVGCDQSTLTVDHIFYPNTSTVYPIGISMEVLYLCGPNTVVYDTAHPYCRKVLINGGCKYVSNSQGCGYADFIYAKSTSTIVLEADTFSYTFKVIYEPGAIIIDQTTNGVLIPCNSLTFPQVNCSVGIRELNSSIEPLRISPNPASDYFDLDVDNTELKKSLTVLSIYNSLGQLVKDEKLIFNNGTARINRGDLENGVYLVMIKNLNQEVAIKKLVINN